MWIIGCIPFLLQAALIAFDEGYFHIRRGLPKWERIGHPIDTASVLVCLGMVLFAPFNIANLVIYILCSSFSSLLVTKDEWVHTLHCPATENWLHAILFTLHPITLVCAGIMWPITQGITVASWIHYLFDNSLAIHWFLQLQFAAMSLFFLYQIVFWNVIWKETQ